MLLACYSHAMVNLQVKNIPDHLHQRLRRCAQDRNATIRDVVLAAVERELARQDWHQRLANRPLTHLGRSAAALLAEERQNHERPVG